jgi:hypothetical protein
LSGPARASLGRLAAVALLLTGVSAETAAEPPRSWRVETERGKSVAVTEVTVGKIEIHEREARVVGQDSHGNPIYRMLGHYQLVEGDRLVLQEGMAFGYTLRLPRLDPGDEIVFQIRIALPRPVVIQGTQRAVVEGEFRFASGESDMVRPLWYSFGKHGQPGYRAEYYQSGEWMFSVLNKGRLLGEQRFTVLPP